MSFDNPALEEQRILHVRIRDGKCCDAEECTDINCLTFSHSAFCNDGLSSYHSAALDGIEQADGEWIFFDWWTGTWTDQAFSGQQQELIQKNPGMNGALFDEILTGNGRLAFADSGFVYDYGGNLPSCMLLRRDVFCTLVGTLRTLYPYPIQKLADAAQKASVKIETIHEPVPGRTPVQDYLVLPADGQGVLRGPNREKKKLLVISHDLDWTGAPIVLAEACIDVLKPAGYEIMVLAPRGGPLADKYLKNGISVMVLPEITVPGSKALYALAQPYDAVIANTTVLYEAVQILDDLKKPVLWWIHECELSYEWLKEWMPQQIGEQVHVRCVGQYALEVLKKYRPDYPAQVLIYGLQDQNAFKEVRKHIPGRKFRFATIGSVEDRKGQDVLCQAISLLNEDIRSRCEFIFAGKAASEEILALMQTTEERYPGCIRYMGLVARDVLAGVYPDIDCVVCPSRDDPMPTYVTEGLMYGKPAICSENTGSAAILRAESAGFVYSDNDPGKLAAAITEYVSLSEEEREAYSEKARACFDNCFTMEVFRKNLLQVIEALRFASADGKR